ncbi:hypothetical protein [Sphingomonas sp. 3-13AW]|uniref:DUF5983 family protein n=1 Tax=Sphingomonas sp. 3-13AW TaxID=3050450 RepID=UPI003BB7B34B
MAGNTIPGASDLHVATSEAGGIGMQDFPTQKMEPGKEMKMSIDNPTATSVTRLASIAYISTGHLTEEVHLVLNGAISAPWFNQISMFPPREYGWFISVPETDDIDPTPPGEEVDPSGYFGIPESLRACFDVARADGAEWILFDRDEEEIEELPFYF